MSVHFILGYVVHRLVNNNNNNNNNKLLYSIIARWPVIKVCIFIVCV